jgi:hypothetical protein
MLQLRLRTASLRVSAGGDDRKTLRRMSEQLRRITETIIIEVV